MKRTVLAPGGLVGVVGPLLQVLLLLVGEEAILPPGALLLRWHHQLWMYLMWLLFENNVRLAGRCLVRNVLQNELLAVAVKGEHQSISRQNSIDVFQGLATELTSQPTSMQQLKKSGIVG